MYLRTLFLLCWSLALAQFALATSWRVNNVSGAPLTNLDDAHTLAAPGDTIYIEGTGLSYGQLTMTKSLTLIGPGYFPGENPNTTVSQTAQLTTLKLNRTTSSDPYSGAAGSTIIGLELGHIDVRVSNIIINKCKLDYIWPPEDDVANLHISQNFFTGYAISTANNHPQNNFTFSNNIVSGRFRLQANSSGDIEHNLFLDHEFEVINFAGNVRSNIFASIQTTDFTLVASSNLVTHNTGGNAQFGTNNSNNTVLPAQMFVGGASSDGQYYPAATALLNTAHDGTHRGPFGGSLPYSLSGLGGIPAITQLVVPPVGMQASPFTVRIRAVSRN